MLEEKNLDVDAFIALLNQQENKKEIHFDDAFEMGKEELVHYIIRKYHIPGLALLDEIDKNLQKLVDVHYDTHGEELSEIYGLFLAIKADMVPHFAKEEKRDFPEFLKGVPVDFTELQEDHEHVGAMFEELEAKTSHYTAPADACLTYKHTFKLMKELQEETHKHIFVETSVLFLM